jgi:hypothetical protein
MGYVIYCWNRDSECLRTGQHGCWSSSPSWAKIFLLSSFSTPALRPVQPPVQWILKALPGGKAVGAWNLPLIDYCRGQEYRTPSRRSAWLVKHRNSLLNMIYEYLAYLICPCIRNAVTPLCCRGSFHHLFRRVSAARSRRQSKPTLHLHRPLYWSYTNFKHE